MSSTCSSRAGQGICGSLSTNPDLRPPPGLEGGQIPGQQCQEHGRVAQPAREHQHRCWIPVLGILVPKGSPGTHREPHRLSCLPSPFCPLLE